MAGCFSKQIMNSNNSNKQKFVIILDERMEERGIQTHLAKGNADVLIVQIAVDSATIHVTTVIEDSEFGIYDGFKMIWVLKSVICYSLLMLLLDARSSHTCFGIGKSVPLRKLSSDAHFTITATKCRIPTTPLWMTTR